MKPGAELIVDCQGIAGDEDMALVPKGRYANCAGIWFLPTLGALKNWLRRTNFKEIECFYAEALSTHEQRRTEWADVKSLGEALDPNDSTRTVEGYPAPHRFYVRCKRG